MTDSKPFDWRFLTRAGLLAGGIIIYTAAVGMIAVFQGRELLDGIFTLGQLLLVAPIIGANYIISRRSKGKQSIGHLLGNSAFVSLVAAMPVVALIILEGLIDIRAMFVSISPDLMAILTFGQDKLVGSFILILILIIVGFISSGMMLIQPLYRRAVLVGLGWVLGVGLMSELLTVTLRPLLGRAFLRLFFRNGTLLILSAIVIFFLAASLTFYWPSRKEQLHKRFAIMRPEQRKTLRSGTVVTGVILLLALPWIIGTFPSEILVNVGLFMLMGLGLNIAVGLAGLLDLGYVTNFAVGAYIAGILSTTGELGGAELSFWIIIPISVLAAMLTGFIFALPVLRMRGDYLAIATLGFGEIIRILALSDWFAPVIGGAQGILAIPSPTIGRIVFSGPQQIYYIILAACLLMIFVSFRLNNSRTGRQWMAIREDEDVAAAMGIDTVKAKLLAFTLSAASGGLAGAIFAAKLGTIFPHSFSLLISVNVLSLIIVGGMGSLPGIMVGALFLIGLPELLREFAEYRLLLYGALLIIMMLAKPEGLWPSAARRRELASSTD